MGFADKFKKVTERAQELAGQAAGELTEAAGTAKAKTTELVGDNRERISSVIDKTASVVNEHTGDKYQGKIDAARAKTQQGLDKVADAAPDKPAASGATDVPPPARPATPAPDPVPAPDPIDEPGPI